MDNIQATILNFRLKNLKNIIKLRRKNAELYKRIIKKDFVFMPKKLYYEPITGEFLSQYLKEPSNIDFLNSCAFSPFHISSYELSFMLPIS